MKTTFKNFRISSSDPVYASCPWDSRNHNRYNITVTNTDNGKRTRFPFYTSIAKPDITEEKELLEAFDCFISDCYSGFMDFREFCNEFGYDEDSRKAFKVWRACVASCARFQRIGGDVNDLDDLRCELDA